MLRRRAKHVGFGLNAISRSPLRGMLRVAAKHGTPGAAPKRAKVAIYYALMEGKLSRCA
jgi:hypothetical protein